MSEILLWPHEALSTVCKSVDVTIGAIDPEVHDILELMLARMREARGIGLAANQIGIVKRLVVLDVGEGPEYFINPSILRVNGLPRKMNEGCLSVPDFHSKVERNPEVMVAYTDINGCPSLVWYTDKRAHVLQHEIEHLDGKIFITKLPRSERDRAAAHMDLYSRRIWK